MSSTEPQQQQEQEKEVASSSSPAAPQRTDTTTSTTPGPRYLGHHKDGTQASASNALRRDASTTNNLHAQRLARQTSNAPSIHLERALSRGVDPAKVTDKRRPWQPKVTPFEQILNEDYEGTGTEEDPYLVDWIDKDPENPMELSGGFKWILCIFVSISTLA